MVIGASVAEDIFRAFLQGLPPGTVYALVALGFVLTYKTSGVFNLAFGAQAYVSAAMFFKARVVWGWGIVPAALLSVVVLAPLIGLLLERLIFRHLRMASALPKLVVAIGLSVAIPNLFDILADFQAVGGTTPEGVMPDGNSVFYDPFGVYSFNRNELAAMVIAVVAALALVALFRFSALGLRMRAVVESWRMAELNGVASDRVSAFSWALSSLFAGLAGVLIAPRFNTLAAADFFHLMVVAIAAAAIGRLSSLPIALVGGLGLGVLIAQMNTFLPRWSIEHAWLRPLQDKLTPAIPFLVLFGVLVLLPGIRRAREAGDPLAGVDPPPPALGTGVSDPKRTLVNRVVAGLLLLGVGAVVLTEGDQVWIFLVTQAVVLATIFLSITLITGMAGQISLCQGAFAATGAFAVFQLSQQHGMAVLPAALIGGLIAAALGAVLSLPIRRLGGVWTAIATLAFAYFFDSVVVNLPFVGGGETSLLQGTIVPRPVIGPFDLASDKSFLVFAVVVLVITAVAVVNLRSGTFGQTLLALRGSEVGAQSIGISPARLRMLAFALSAFIAAFGGALLAMQQENVSYGASFSPFVALFWVVMVVTLGARTVSGAVQAAAAFVLFEPVVLRGQLLAWILRSSDRVPGVFPISPKWVFVLFGLGAIQYARHPEGFVEHSLHRRALKAQARMAAVAVGAIPADVEEPAAVRAEEPVA
jgi:branched-subunit amino acid ABC-type transport system permease component